MARFVVVYKTPKDPDAFTRHYFEKHVPLAKQLPGLRKYEVSTGPIQSMAAEKDAFLVAILHFDSLEAIRAAFASPVGQACGEDRRAFAPDPATFHSFIFEEREV